MKDVFVELSVPGVHGEAFSRSLLEQVLLALPSGPARGVKIGTGKLIGSVAASWDNPDGTGVIVHISPPNAGEVATAYEVDVIGCNNPWWIRALTLWKPPIGVGVDDVIEAVEVVLARDSHGATACWWSLDEHGERHPVRRGAAEQ